ncbi:hypothetical protein GQX74_014095 [Glossina fuscipes]|nr:hypothetical protein GQX74_014095 [Glossina fuscipes]
MRASRSGSSEGSTTFSLKFCNSLVLLVVSVGSTVVANVPVVPTLTCKRMVKDIIENYIAKFLVKFGSWCGVVWCLEVLKSQDTHQFLDTCDPNTADQSREHCNEDKSKRKKRAVKASSKHNQDVVIVGYHSVVFMEHVPKGQSVV